MLQVIEHLEFIVLFYILSGFVKMNLNLPGEIAGTAAQLMIETQTAVKTEVLLSRKRPS